MVARGRGVVFSAAAPRFFSATTGRRDFCGAMVGLWGWDIVDKYRRALAETLLCRRIERSEAAAAGVVIILA